MIHVNITLAQPGFKGRMAKYRVAVYTCDSGWDGRDARSAAYRAAKARGKARVIYTRGAVGRDFYAAWLPRQIG